MYLKSIDELPTPFPLSAFITFHSLSLPSVAFHCLLSPFITFHRRPISLSAHSLLSPVLSSSRSRFVLTSPRFVLTSPRSLTMPPHSPASHLLPSCFITPFVSHIRLSRTIVCAPLFCFPFLLPPLFYTALLYSLPLFYVLCFISSPFALLSPIVYPLRFIYSHCFAPVFLLPGNLRKPVPDTAKGNVFLIFQRNFAKSP